MKSLSLRYLGMLVFLLLCCVACTDHEPQVKTYSSVTTILVEQQSDGNHLFEISINSLGNVPIKEFGIVYSLQLTPNSPYNATPTINDSKLVFNQATTVGGHSMKSTLPTFSGIAIRAYAIHQDDVVVYGEPIDYD